MRLLVCSVGQSSGLVCSVVSGFWLVVPEKTLGCLYLLICSVGRSSVLLPLFPLFICRFVVIAEFPLGCLVERLTRLMWLLSSLIVLFVDRKLVPRNLWTVDRKLVQRDLWTVHLQVGSVGRSTDVILIKSVGFK